MKNDNSIAMVVHETLSTYTRKGAVITGEANIIRDLKLTSDDATQFALDLEAKLKTKIPREEWRRAITVGDVTRLFEKHRVEDG
jgi:acyl carrier protein